MQRALKNSVKSIFRRYCLRAEGKIPFPKHKFAKWLITGRTKDLASLRSFMGMRSNPGTLSVFKLISTY